MNEAGWEPCDCELPESDAASSDEGCVVAAESVGCSGVGGVGVLAGGPSGGGLMSVHRILQMRISCLCCDLSRQTMCFAISYLQLSCM